MLALIVTLFVYNYMARKEAYFARMAIEQAQSQAEWLEVERGGNPTSPMPARPPELRWTAERQGAELLVVYEVFNPGDDPIWIFDEIEGGDESVRVRRGEHDGEAILLKGVYVHIDLHQIWSPDVFARRVEAGEIVTGHARTSLPVQADVISEARQILTHPVEQIRLEIAWVSQYDELTELRILGELDALDPIEWWEPKVPLYVGYPRQRWLTSDPRPLPE